VPRSRPPGQAWATFLRHHAGETWACDFLPVTDLLFRPLFACFLVELGSRRVVHIGVTRHPTDAWVTQQLREATPYGEQPRFLVRDNDAKFGPRFAQVAVATFANPNGLIALDGNAYRRSNASGPFSLKGAGTGGAGMIAPSTLESSTVDLSTEFTGLIVTQRAYSASSKIITTADAMLEELINIKR
jgi:hypothetical protein